MGVSTRDTAEGGCATYLFAALWFRAINDVYMTTRRPANALFLSLNWQNPSDRAPAPPPPHSPHPPNNSSDSINFLANSAIEIRRRWLSNCNR